MLIRRAGEHWHEPAVTSYLNENALQEVLAGAPHLLPGDDAPLVVVREFPLSSGSLDLLGVEPSGQIVLCECKLDANPQARRTVVGQLLCYAGALWEMPFDDFSSRFANRHGAPMTEAVRAIAGEEWEEEQFRQALAENLETGNFRLIVAVDGITDELRKALHYLNLHSAPGIEVLALELDYKRDGEVEVLVPRSYGEEVAPPKPRRRTWDEQSLFEVLEQGCSPDGVAATRELWGFLKERCARLSWGSGHGAGVSCYLTVDGQEQPVIGIYAYTDSPSTVAINFEYLAGRGVRQERLAQIASEIRTIPGAAEKLEGLEEADFRKRPGLPIDHVIVADGAVTRLKVMVESLESPL